MAYEDLHDHGKPDDDLAGKNVLLFLFYVFGGFCGVGVLVSVRFNFSILLQRHDIAVVLCERDLQPGTYIDLLKRFNALANVTSLIVASRLADERLWAEALNLGAWDVLAKPFDPSEVLRSVKSGWQHWHNQTHMHATAVKIVAASS